MKKKLLLLTIAVLCFASFASADSFVFYGSRAAQNPTDFIDLSQLPGAGNGSLVTSPQPVTSFLGNSALIGNTNGGQFLTVQESYTWLGNFDYGEYLAWTGNPNFGIGSGGPFAIVLANPASSIGIGIQADLFGGFTAKISLFNTGGVLIYSNTFSGVSNGSEAGDNLFVGLGDLTGVNIGAIVISTDSGANNPMFSNDFAVNDPSFTYAPIPTPEPGSLMLLGSGLLGVAGLVRRKMGR